MTHFFNNKQILMENVSFQDLTPKLFKRKGIIKEWIDSGRIEV
ncbi:MAG TPA: hypothetical protein VFD10_02620 [Atribacterota bacterium]|nr:hypothetical protein [Atribacterota bacterium]